MRCPCRVVDDVYHSQPMRMMSNASDGMRCEIELAATAKLGYWATSIKFDALDLYYVKGLADQEKEVALTISGPRWIAEQRERGKKALDVVLLGAVAAAPLLPPAGRLLLRAP